MATCRQLAGRLPAIKERLIFMIECFIVVFLLLFGLVLFCLGIGIYYGAKMYDRCLESNEDFWNKY